MWTLPLPPRCCLVGVMVATISIPPFAQFCRFLLSMWRLLEIKNAHLVLHIKMHTFIESPPLHIHSCHSRVGRNGCPLGARHHCWTHWSSCCCRTTLGGPQYPPGQSLLMTPPPPSPGPHTHSPGFHTTLGCLAPGLGRRWGGASVWASSWPSWRPWWRWRG